MEFDTVKKYKILHWNLNWKRERRNKHKDRGKWWSSSGIYSLLWRTDAWGSAAINFFDPYVS